MFMREHTFPKTEPALEKDSRAKDKHPFLKLASTFRVRKQDDAYYRRQLVMLYGYKDEK
jgi:hypothetical protein